MTAFRNLEGVKGNGQLDAFFVDWHILKADPDNDLRDLTTPENRAHIERLKDSISVVGVKDPLLVRRDDDDTVFAIDGRCRLVALAELEAEGRNFPPKVKTLPEQQGTDRKKRMLNMLTVGRDRKNLTDFEFARGLYRSIELGYSEKEVCEEMGWKAIGTLHNHLDSLTLKPKLKEMVEKSQISRTEALKLQAKTDLDPGQLMQDVEDEQRRLNKKGPAKIRPRHVKQAAAKTTGKPDKLPVPPRAPRAAETEQREPASSAAPEPTSASASLPAAPIFALAPSPDAAPGIKPNGQAAKDLMEALAPFAGLANDHDLTALEDSDILEVFVRDVRRAALVYTSAIGVEG